MIYIQKVFQQDWNAGVGHILVCLFPFRNDTVSSFINKSVTDCILYY